MTSHPLDQALLDATLLDDIAAMRNALAGGGNVNARDPEHQETPLMLARSEAVVKLLLDNNADLHAVNDWGQTALMYRPWRAIWERGGDINAQSDAGKTPLMKAVMTGNPERVGQVLSMGADVLLKDGEGRTALDIALEWGLSGIAERLKAGFEEQEAAK
ncbi:MAG: ankyrin repeat domain-containing protein [Janthinobacterium lividum]